MPRIYNQKEIKILKEGGKILASIVSILIKNVKPKVTGVEIDRLAHDLMIKAGGVPSFLHHQGFPASSCISVNEEVVHSKPKKVAFKNGDIVGIDVGLNYKGLHTDMAVTLTVGKVDPKIKKFINCAKDALIVAVKKSKPGATTGDIGAAIQKFVEAKRYSIVRELSGHGVGASLHEEPTIPNYGIKGEGEKILPGMVIAIEPIINMGSREVETGIDGWRISTKDKSLSAHFEHTILITKKGNQILTELEN